MRYQIKITRKRIVHIYGLTCQIYVSDHEHSRVLNLEEAQKNVETLGPMV